MEQSKPLEELEAPVRKNLIVDQNDLLAKIAWCESRQRQFNKDGSVLRGVENNKDVGYFQINEYYHLEDSKRLGMDIYTLEGNMAYGEYLFSKQGSQPWSASRHCWDK